MKLIEENDQSVIKRKVVKVNSTPHPMHKDLTLSCGHKWLYRFIPKQETVPQMVSCFKCHYADAIQRFCEARNLKNERLSDRQP